LNNWLRAPKFDVNKHCGEILLGVAKGMAHLHKSRFVHGNLAAKNVLLSNLDINGIKVGNYGIKKLVDLLPEQSSTQFETVRWMAPESIISHDFTLKSDVWSYGVFIYEVLARDKPFSSLPYSQVITQIVNNGLVVQPPENSPRALKQLILDCCSKQPEKRPSFEFICERLKSSFSHHMFTS